jgi:hypothetical protein
LCSSNIGINVLDLSLIPKSSLFKDSEAIYYTHKNNEKINPSVMWQKRRQVCGFLFANCDASDCFYNGLMSRFLFSLQCSVYRNNCLEFLWHLGHRENNLFKCSDK